MRVAGTKTSKGDGEAGAGSRTLRLPGWAVDLLIRRGDELGWRGPVFPASKAHERQPVNRVGGSWRDPNNTARSFRQARDAAGFGWVTSHVMRKTVATWLDSSGLTARKIADQLGHANIAMTQRHYLGRRAVSPAAATALESFREPDAASAAADDDAEPGRRSAHAGDPGAARPRSARRGGTP